MDRVERIIQVTQRHAQVWAPCGGGPQGGGGAVSYERGTPAPERGSTLCRGSLRFHLATRRSASFSSARVLLVATARPASDTYTPLPMSE